MSNTLSRRQALRGATASVLVAGWSISTQSWAVAGTTDPDLVELPSLDGTLETEAVSGFRHDFGRMVDSDPWAVLRPGSVDDIVKMIDYARSNGLHIAMNGRSGTGDDLESHSSFGQALVPGGISIDARGLSRIISIDSDSAVVEPGVTWATLTEAALEVGATPPALTDYLHLSIGGTLSIGGVGSTVHRYGFQVDTVTSVDVVTGEGELVTASPTQSSDLFEAVLSGGGQCGVIVRATVDLVPAPDEVLVCSLVYDDLDVYMADQEKALEEGRFDAQAGEAGPSPDGSGWVYKLEGIAFHPAGSPPDQDELLSGFNDDRSSAEIVGMPYRDYAFRLDAFESELKEGGFWTQPKPWLSMFMPASSTKQFLEEALADLTQDDLGAGFLLCYPYHTGKSTRPLVMQPGEPVGYLFDLLRFPAPDGPDSGRMLEQNRRLHDRGVELGGKRYLVGAVPEMTVEDWQEHFGNRWTTFREQKERHDPDGILTPGQAFFG